LSGGKYFTILASALLILTVFACPAVSQEASESDAAGHGLPATVNSNADRPTPAPEEIDRAKTGGSDAKGSGHEEVEPGHEEEAHGDEAHGGHGGHAWNPPKWSILGFVGMLLSIAIFPLVSPHWWEHNKNRAIVSAFWGVPLAVYVLFIEKQPIAMVHSLHEYEQFIILLAALFVISGGIWLSGDVRSTPRNNMIFIAIGSVLASFIGTTGAAMLLIRPLIRTNSQRKYVMHTVIFFIFLVANIGGSLTPLGDPPLFLGYLRGVEFTWTFKLWIFWLPTVLWLLTLYFIVDTVVYRKYESDEAKVWDDTNIEPLKLRGAHNFIFLFGVVLSIYFYPDMKKFLIENMNVDPHSAEYVPVRECLMILMAVLAWFTTKPEYRQAQNFTWSPIIEVAILFLAIFITMIPALAILNAWGPNSPVKEPWHFFWITGILSSFLDNAPTYLTFFALGTGQCVGGNCPEAYKLLSMEPTYISEVTLTAIAVGAVFMGANTYIGNAPNFMVKSISEENKVKMPSFFGYMLWSGGILIPTFVIITFIAFRG
jgi:Na+/H+ antiporter NhaD/arsenite permease-like protein